MYAILIDSLPRDCHIFDKYIEFQPSHGKWQINVQDILFEAIRKVKPLVDRSRYHVAIVQDFYRNRCAGRLERSTNPLLRDVSSSFHVGKSHDR